MYGIAILATLVLGGVIIGLDDDDDTVVSETETTEDAQGLSEEVTASSGGDLLELGSENDTVFALAGDDEVFAGQGDDVVFGGAGDDDIFGQAGNDDLHGGDGDDDIFGSGGEDTLSGDAGDDDLIASAGDDTIFSGEGEDIAIGGTGADSIQGGADNDVLFGGAFDSEPDSEGLDALRAGEDTEFAVVDDGAADTLNGGDGDDGLILDDGDLGRGGEGNDSFFVVADGNVDEASTISDYSEDDDEIVIALIEGSDLTEDDFTVERDPMTEDALILQDGEVLARVADAGNTLTVDDLTFSAFLG